MNTHADHKDAQSSQNAGLPASRESRSVAHRTALAQAIGADPETATNALEPSRALEKWRRQFNKGLITLEELERLGADGPANLRLIAQGSLVGCFRFFRFRAETTVTATMIRRLGDARWIATLDDRDPALGPAGFGKLGGLPQLLFRSTLCVVDPGHRTAKFYRHLIRAASMGARIVIVETEPSHNEAWAKFLEFYALEASQYLMEKVLNKPGK
jgi:hypothetical protein